MQFRIIVLISVLWGWSEDPSPPHWWVRHPPFFYFKVLRRFGIAGRNLRKFVISFVHDQTDDRTADNPVNEGFSFCHYIWTTMSVRKDNNRKKSFS